VQRLALTVSAPVRRLAVLGVAAVTLGAVRIPDRPHTLCLFRAVTGVPCPFCGGTTTAVDVGRGNLGAAVVANPLVFIGAIVLVLAATPFGRHAVKSWRALPTTSKVMLSTTVLIVSECWQLARFGLL
jgi:Protein of unknown function (DUF2752)